MGSRQLSRATRQSEMTDKRTVMICDDERDILDLYRRVLRSKFDVLTVASGCECLEKYKEEKAQGNRIDLVLVDYRLGDILGDEVACKIKELNGTKVAMISAYEPDPELIEKLKSMNCIIDWMKKPMPVSAMVIRIEQILA